MLLSQLILYWHVGTCKTLLNGSSLSPFERTGAAGLFLNTNFNANVHTCLPFLGLLWLPSSPALISFSSSSYWARRPKEDIQRTCQFLLFKNALDSSIPPPPKEYSPQLLNYYFPDSVNFTLHLTSFKCSKRAAVAWSPASARLTLMAVCRVENKNFYDWFCEASCSL